jgi:predicted GIY-YIG superfamily endonuclease
MARTKWTIEALKNSASKYKTVKEWRLSEPSAYVTASRLRILPELTAGMTKKIDHGFWKAEVVVERAKKFKHKRDWIKEDYQSYTAAQRLGIVDKASEHMTPLGNTHKRCLYSIEVIGQNLIYIGLTYDFRRRMRDHMKSARFLELIRKYGEGCIEQVQLTSYIDKDEAAKIEGLLVEEYKEKGYQILNIQKTGSLGGNIIKWTKEAILDDAKKYTRVMDWANTPGSGYPSASAMGIIEECTAHMQRLIKTPGSYTKKDIGEASIKFKQVSEWVRLDRKTYQAAKRMNLLNDPEVVGHFTKGQVVNKKWKKDAVIEESSKYASVSEWKRNSPGSYKAAKADGYYEEIKSSMSPPKRALKWSEESILNDALKYTSRSDWKLNSCSAYVQAQKMGIIDKACEHMKLLNPKGRWSTSEAIIEEARKYSSKSEWRIKSSGSYEAAKKFNIFDVAVAHMKRPDMRRKWDETSIQDDALKYTSKTTWARESPGAYEAAKKRNIFNEVTAHMIRSPIPIKWDDQSIRDDAKKYTSKNEWKRNSIGAYTAAKRTGIYESVTQHM